MPDPDQTREADTLPQDSPVVYAMVAGEASGDILGAGLIRAIKQRQPQAEFIGVGGEQMLAEGFHTLADMERLSVMGLVEPLKRLPELFALRKRLYQTFLQRRPAVFVGIDAPDFNLGLARKLKQSGIKTVQYVCPSVWAWRQGRVKKIRRSVDHVLALLPFESEFLQQHAIASTFVGHPLAEQLEHESQQEDIDAELQQQLQSFSARLESNGALVCVMPGSRNSEVSALAETFFQTIAHCLQRDPSLRFVVPAASDRLYQDLSERLADSAQAAIRPRVLLVNGQSRACMRAADVILLASGTATLEAAILGKPMVVAYKMAAATYALAKRMVKLDHVALPNLLTAQPLVPEFIQHDASPEALSNAVMTLLNDEQHQQQIAQAFTQLRSTLTQNASAVAADVVLSQLQAT